MFSWSIQSGHVYGNAVYTEEAMGVYTTIHCVYSYAEFWEKVSVANSRYRSIKQDIGLLSILDL